MEHRTEARELLTYREKPPLQMGMGAFRLPCTDLYKQEQLDPQEPQENW